MHTLTDYQNIVRDIFEQENFIYKPHELYDPIDYTLRLGGKRLRPTLLLAACGMFGGPVEKAYGAALGIETFHNFTLLHDDLMDRSPLRRGQPTVYRRWNENTAILSGDTMYALAWRYFLRTPLPMLHDILTTFNEMAIEVCEGQQYDMNFERLTDVSLDQYMLMIRKKTAVLLAAALKIGALCASAPARDIEKVYNFGIHLGLAFQIQDDLLDGYGDTAVFGKKTGQDIRDNKKTFLPLLAETLATTADRDALHRLFATDNTCDEEQKVADVMHIYDRIGLRHEVEKTIAEQFALATTELNEIAVDEKQKNVLRQLTETLIDRKK